MAPGRTHATEFGHFTGNDLHPRHGPFDPSSYAGYAPPGAPPSISPPGGGSAPFNGYGYTYPYPPSSSSGYTPSAVAAKAFNSTPPGYGPPQISPAHAGFPHPGHGVPPMGPGSMPAPIPMNTPSEEPSRRKKLLKKLSRGLLRSSADPAPGAPGAPVLAPVLAPAQASAPSYPPQPIQHPPPQPPSSSLGLSFTSSRKRSKSNASQTQADYQPISVEDFAAIVAETGSLSRYPALSLPGADGAMHAHPHKRLPDRGEREERGRPSTRDMSEGGVMRNPSRTPKDDPDLSDSSSDSYSDDPPSFGSDQTRWPAGAPTSDAGHSTRSRAESDRKRYLAPSEPVGAGVGLVTHAAPPGSAYPESHMASVHSSWSRHGGAGRSQSTSYYDDADHYTAYATPTTPGAPVPPGSASSHHGAPPGHHSYSGVPPGHVGSSASGHLGVPVPGTAGSHSSHLAPPPIATSSGSRRSHRPSVSLGGADELGYAGRDTEKDGERGSRSHRDKQTERDLERARAMDRGDMDLARDNDRRREHRHRHGHDDGERDGHRHRGDDRDNRDRRDRDRSRSRHSHLSQASSYKTYGSYSPVPFETPPAPPTASLSSHSNSQPAHDPRHQGSTTLPDGRNPAGTAGETSPKTILKAPSMRSQHSFAPSTAPSVGSTWSYHAPPAPTSAGLGHPPPGVAGSHFSSTSPYTAPVQPQPFTQAPPPQPYDNPYRTSPTLSHTHPQSISPTHSRRSGHRHSVSGPMMSSSMPAGGGPGMGYYQYAGWNAPPPGAPGSIGGAGVPMAPGSAGGGGLPPGQHPSIDHSRRGGVPRSQGSHSGSSRSGSVRAGDPVPTSRRNDRGRDREGREASGRGRSRSVDALKAARQKDYAEKMRILQAQGSVGSASGSSRRKERRQSEQVYPPGPYGVPGAYSGSHHSHSPVERRDRDRESHRESHREREREREERGRSKSRERNVLRKRSESRRRRDDDGERERGESRSRSRPRHREDFDELEREQERERRRERRHTHGGSDGRGHEHERHIDVDEVMDIERNGAGRNGPRVLTKSRSRHGSSAHPSASSMDPSSSSQHHSHHHQHHSSSSPHSPSHHRHHAHSALVGSSTSSRARHARRRESLEKQGISHPRFEDGAFADPRRERESGIGVVYPVEAYPGREGSRSRSRERRERKERRNKGERNGTDELERGERERREREKMERRERRKTVSGVPIGGAGWYPV